MTAITQGGVTALKHPALHAFIPPLPQPLVTTHLLLSPPSFTERHTVEITQRVAPSDWLLSLAKSVFSNVCL